MEGLTPDAVPVEELTPDAVPVEGFGGLGIVIPLLGSVVFSSDMVYLPDSETHSRREIMPAKRGITATK